MTAPGSAGEDAAEPTPLVLVEDLPTGVRELSLNRPHKLNALSTALRSALRDAFVAAGAAENVRVMVLRGEGRSFFAGADLGRVVAKVDLTPAENRERLLEQTLELALTPWDLHKPVIAQIHGHCVGIATILASCCDLVIVDEEASISWPGLPLGGGMIGPTWAWHVGVHRAKEYSYQIGL